MLIICNKIIKLLVSVRMSLMYGNSAVPKGVSISCRWFGQRLLNPLLIQNQQGICCVGLCDAKYSRGMADIFTGSVTEIIFNSRYLSCNFVIATANYI